MFLKSLLVLGGVPWVFGKVQYMVGVFYFGVTGMKLTF